MCGACWAAWRAEIVARQGGQVDHGGVIGREHIIWRADGAVQVGGARPDHGPDQFEVGCPACDATWIGRVGSACWYCAQRDARIVAEQRALLLAGPGDIVGELHAVFESWRQRLLRAVEAEVLTRDEVRDVWTREVARHA